MPPGAASVRDPCSSAKGADSTGSSVDPAQSMDAPPSPQGVMHHEAQTDATWPPFAAVPLRYASFPALALPRGTESNQHDSGEAVPICAYVDHPSIASLHPSGCKVESSSRTVLESCRHSQDRLSPSEGQTGLDDCLASHGIPFFWPSEKK